jgi:hypothetical protein
MCRKLDRKTVVGASVLSGNKPLHYQPRTHIDPLDFIKRFGVKVFGSLSFSRHGSSIVLTSKFHGRLDSRKNPTAVINQTP